MFEMAMVRQEVQNNQEGNEVRAKDGGDALELIEMLHCDIGMFYFSTG